jgi:hypothetical protein
MKLRIYKSANILSASFVDVETFNAKVNRTLNGRDEITFQAILRDYEEFPIGSTISVEVGNNYEYHLYELPTYEKKANYLHVYNLKFEAPIFNLKDVSYVDTDLNTEFFLNGRLSDYIDLLIDNIERSAATFSTWEKGIIPTTDFKNIQFNSQNCWQVINTLCNEYDLEFYTEATATGYKLSFYEKVGNSKMVTLEYGKGSGLNNLKRTNVNTDELITRLFYRGSDANLPTDYPYKRLRGTTNFIEANTGMFGVHEGIKVFDEIKPSYIGHVDGYSYDDVYDEYLLTDASFPFDLKAKDGEGDTTYLIAGTTAKINFRTGNCAGYTFDIKDYDHETNTFKLIPFDEENGYRVPNDTVFPSAANGGDQYVVFDINLPDEYVTNAGSDLDVEANKYLEKRSTPRVQYSLEADKVFFTENDIQLDLGDQITVNDSDLEISSTCRVIELTFFLFDRFSQTIKLSDVRFAVPNRKTQMRLNTIERFVENNKLGNVQKTLKSQKTTGELKSQVFDYKDNYFIPENNRPESLDPYMIALDSGEIQFSLKSAAIEPNIGADPLAVKVGEGELIHHSFFGKTRAEIKEIKDAGIDYVPTRIWTIPETIIEAADPSVGYFVYAKLPLLETEEFAQIIIDTEHIVAKRDVEFDPEARDYVGYIHYKLGYLSEVKNNKRSLNQLWSESGDDKSFVYEQNMPTNMWTVEHELSKYPAVTVVDTAGSVVDGKVEYLDLNTVQLTFNSAFSGKAYFS